MKRHLLPIFLITTVSLVVYANTLKNGFLLDDDNFIIRSDYIKDWKNSFTIFTPQYRNVPARHVDLNRPVMTWSLIWDYALWGLNPFGYHLTNLLLHSLNVILLYFLGLLILQRQSIALLGAIIFAVHPIHTEAVNGINFREDLLVTVFYLLATITFIKGDRSKEPLINKMLSLTFFAAGLLSKETAITLIPIMAADEIASNGWRRSNICNAWRNHTSWMPT